MTGDNTGFCRVESRQRNSEATQVDGTRCSLWPFTVSYQSYPRQAKTGRGGGEGERLHVLINGRILNGRTTRSKPQLSPDQIYEDLCADHTTRAGYGEEQQRGGHRPDPSASPPRLSFDLEKRREEVHKPASASLRFVLSTRHPKYPASLSDCQ